jgi:hypothetical protein
MTQSRWFLPLAVALFVAGSAWMWASGDEADRNLALGAFLFFGVGGGCAAIAQLLGRSRIPVIRGVIALPDGSSEDALILPYLGMPWVLRMIAGVGAVGGCAVWAVTDATNSPALRLIAALGGVFFAVAIALRLRPGGNRAGYLALTSWGAVIETGTDHTAVPWAVVDRVGRVDYRRQPMLMLSVRDPDAVVRTGAGQALNLVGTLFFGRNAVPASLGRLGLPPDRTVGLVERFFAASRHAPTTDDTTSWPPLEDLAEGFVAAPVAARARQA